jgi:transcriptional regulator with GAF, ATPase, and Fis domain
VSENKKPDSPEAVLPVADREQNFATSFEDQHVLQELTETVSVSQNLIEETAEAVQELVGITESTNPSVHVYGYDQENTTAVAKAEIAERLFTLVLSELKFEILVEEILKALMKAIDAQAGSILEHDVAANEFFFRATFGGGDPEELKAFKVPAKSGIVGHVAESRQSLVIQDLDDSQMHLKAISMSVGFETKSCIAVPILIANQLYGVLEVFNKVGTGYFDLKDQQLLEDCIKMAAKVLEVRFFAAEILKRKAG